MNDSPTATALWEEQQRRATARTGDARRESLKNFALVFAVIVLTLAVAMAISRVGIDGIRLR
jgi:hypothetical protein